MTLFEKLKDIIGLGWQVKFSSFGFQFIVIVSKIDDDENIYVKESHLPLQDHFTESRIINCIDWSISEIQKEYEKKD